ncbi:NUDIX domain-containing protein [Vibrio sp. CAIM 722]|uniref:GDP-mannose pyrophosphatase n=1 Tax=Vibrio eleionomae TaxID=2653505 RepID=A0A7X4LPU5_9VIBR|nr:NUDIX hydrolase [Vibrio eleionomae]MZI95401.1 NUDIX domain-containing protein [Vibrio eleionomae]
MNKLIHQWKKTIALTEQDITLPNGKTIIHTTIEHPGAAVIIPITQEKRVIMVNQYRPSVKAWTIEVPAGTMELGEDPLTCAQRELEEETGYSADTFQSLGQLIPMAGMCNEKQHLYIATGLHLTQRLECDDDEIIEVQTYSLQELETMIANGEISDSKTVACLYRAKLAGYL